MLTGHHRDRSFSCQNDPAQQPAGPESHRTSESRHAPPVCCSVWFGLPQPQNTKPNTHPTTRKNTNNDTASGFDTSRHK